MRGFLALAVLATVVAATSTSAAQADPWPPAHHSASVADVSWEPRTPARGEDVHVTARLQPNASAADVILRVCRVQAYACRAPIVMADTSGPEGEIVYQATNDWNAQFFDGVTEVGLAVILQTNASGGHPEESPLENWPQTPDNLPDGAGHYYFYELPPHVHDSPSAALVASLAAVAVAALAWPRRP